MADTTDEHLCARAVDQRCSQCCGISLNLRHGKGSRPCDHFNSHSSRRPLRHAWAPWLQTDQPPDTSVTDARRTGTPHSRASWRKRRRCASQHARPEWLDCRPGRVGPIRRGVRHLGCDEDDCVCTTRACYEPISSESSRFVQWFSPNRICGWPPTGWGIVAGTS
jgi:hypothetical protein